MMMKIFILCLWGLCFSALQAQQLNDFQLTEMEKIYSDAHLYMFKPKFIKGSDCFWYKLQKGDVIEYYWIDPECQRQRLLFNDVFLKNELERLTESKLENHSVNVDLEFVDGGEKCFFVFEKGRYCYEMATQRLLCVNDFFVEDSLSVVWNKNNTHALFVRDYNLFLQSGDINESVQLTTNGERYYSYGVNDSDIELGESSMQWLSDNKTFCGLRKDNRKNLDFSLMNALSSPRPRIHYYKSNVSTEDSVSYQFWIGSIEQLKIRKFGIKCGREEAIYFVGFNIEGSDAFFLVKYKNSGHAKLKKLNLADKKYEILIDNLFVMNEADIVMLENGKKWLVRSDNTGLPHYYLYDENGRLLQRITSGNWIAGPLLNVDHLKQKIYFCVYSRENVYGEICCCDINKENHIKILSKDKAFHDVSFSPSGKFFLDIASYLDGKSSCCVCNTKGRVVYEFDLPDNLENIIPEYFRIPVLNEYAYGLIWKPLRCNSEVSYPVISYIYPEQNIFARSFFHSSAYQQIIQWVKLGFVVVTAKPNHPWLRSRSYTSDFDYVLLSRLIVNNKCMDIAKVGIYGKGRAGNVAVEAIGKYSNFYKAAVAYGVDYLPFTREKKEQLAKNIMTYRKGLLLITRDFDKKNQLFSTYGLINEFINMEKNVKLVVLPGEKEKSDTSYQFFCDYKIWSHWMDYLYDVHDKDIQKEFNINNLLVK